MAKHIHPAELAEIVSQLLTGPRSSEELGDTYESFLVAIGTVVTDHCGGQVEGVMPGAKGGKWDSSLPHLVVNPSGSLPSLTDSVWSSYDAGAWEGEGLVTEYSDGAPMCPSCGCAVQEPHNQACGVEWVGTCDSGHVRAFMKSRQEGAA